MKYARTEIPYPLDGWLNPFGDKACLVLEAVKIFGLTFRRYTFQRWNGRPGTRVWEEKCLSRRKYLRACENVAWSYRVSP